MCLPYHCCRLANILNSMKSHHLSPMLNESEVSVFDDKPTGGTKCVRATSSYLCVHFLRSPDGEVSSVSVLFVCLQLFTAYHAHISCFVNSMAHSSSSFRNLFHPLPHFWALSSQLLDSGTQIRFISIKMKTNYTSPTSCAAPSAYQLSLAGAWKIRAKFFPHLRTRD